MPFEARDHVPLRRPALGASRVHPHPPMKKLGATFLLLLTGVAMAHGQGSVRDIGDRKQLFIDHRFIQHAEGVELHMNPPVKCGVVLSGNNSWENGMVTDAVTVIEDAGKFRMWYTACPASGPALEPFRLCYAESNDGEHWIKPNLGIYEWEGSKTNNILMDSNIENGGGVFVDPRAPPSQRYKLLARLSSKRVAGQREEDPQVNNAPNGPGLYIYTSADGLRWDLHPTRVFPFSPDTDNMAFYDRRTGKYLAYVRLWNPLRRVGVVVSDDIMQPWPYDKSVAPRLWPGRPAENPAPSREIAEAFGPDRDDPANVDFYTSATVEYPWAEDAYFMFPSAYRHFPDPPEGKYRNDGLIDIALAVSRDGRKFHRTSKAPYVRMGLNGAPDSGSMYMGIGMIRRGATIYQYYGGYDFTHAGYVGLPEIKNQGGVMLLRQRLDGFISADADEKGGEFATPPLRFRGARLCLNLDASATGEVRVELRGADNRSIAGYSFAECDPLYQNGVAKLVTWRGDSEVGRFAGKPVQLGFRCRNVKLYAFQFGD